MSSDVSPLAASAIARLRAPATIRERAEMVLRNVEDGQSPHFALDANGLENAVRLTLAVIH